MPERNIDSDFIGEVEIVFPYNNIIRRNPPVVEVSFDVEKLMELNDRVPLEILNAMPRARAGTNSTEVNCTFRLPVSMVKTLSLDSLKAVVDLKNVPSGSHKFIPQIIGLPEQAHLIKVDTVLVTF